MKKQIISMALAAIISASAIAAFTTSASAEWVDYNGKISYISGDYGDWDQLEAEQASFAFGEALKVDRAWKTIFGSLPVNLAEIPEAPEDGCVLNN